MACDSTIATSIHAFSPEEWNRCFPGEAEDWSFYSACEAAGPPDFTWFYVALREEGRLIAVAPAFGTTYRLDTTLQGPLRRLTDRLYRLMPGLMSMRMLAFGSPVAETCHLGFAPHVAPARRGELLGAMMAALQAYGHRNGYHLIAVKDVPERDMPVWRDRLAEGGYTRLSGLPTACLDLPYASFEDYLASLSKATRKDMRRKMKALDELRIEQRRTIDDIVPAIEDLYQQTVAHSELQFEHLPGAYFDEVTRQMAPRTSVMLYWAGNRLVAFNFMIESDGRLIDKYIGMDYDAVRRYNLYFNSWLVNVRYCIEAGIPIYQSGQAFYGPKLRLGCRLHANWQYFRHRNAVLNATLRLVARVVALDRFDPAIAELTKAAA
ncbi:GNAT family N-acetyltransferase [Ancylobacter sp. 6x-1]|uniref:GNAT family N-acetyltransferase n=1 Tax=Ancylobacter crimeensis TaxID=2579147 RepID=A0ABT0D9V4_9HYPH|nr:GNAT family N-acetyltransferase [Ancylobacter crimeensis]MCK0196735.1 GNAT family N-acetyltransferase [Ancylobacter crimeensis]